MSFEKIIILSFICLLAIVGIFYVLYVLYRTWTFDSLRIYCGKQLISEKRNEYYRLLGEYRGKKERDANSVISTSVTSNALVSPEDLLFIINRMQAESMITEVTANEAAFKVCDSFVNRENLIVAYMAASDAIRDATSNAKRQEGVHV